MRYSRAPRPFAFYKLGFSQKTKPFVYKIKTTLEREIAWAISNSKRHNLVFSSVTPLSLIVFDFHFKSNLAVILQLRTISGPHKNFANICNYQSVVVLTTPNRHFHAKQPSWSVPCHWSQSLWHVWYISVFLFKWPLKMAKIAIVILFLRVILRSYWFSAAFYIGKT